MSAPTAKSAVSELSAVAFHHESALLWHFGVYVQFWKHFFFLFFNSAVIDRYGANHSAGMLQRNSGGIACEV